MTTRERLIDDMCRLDARNTLFGMGIQQSWSSLFLLNKVIVENPDITRIVELGTLTGGFSMLLGMTVKPRGGTVLTFDSKRSPDDHVLAAFELFNVEFRRADIWDAKSLSEIEDFIRDERALIFCDNGNKAVEFPFFVKMAKPNDVIMAHDWMMEIHPQHLDEATLRAVDLYLQPEFNSATARILSVKKREAPSDAPLGIIRSKLNSRE